MRPFLGSRLAPRDPLVAGVLISLAVLAVLGAGLVGCSKAEEVAVRAEREAFCLKWRATKEIGKRADSPVVLSALRRASSTLKSSVPDERRAQLDTVLDGARRLATAADSVAGGTDEALTGAAREQVAKGYRLALGELDGYCKSSLAG